jgi:hypothetical protein
MNYDMPRNYPEGHNTPCRGGDRAPCRVPMHPVRASQSAREEIRACEGCFVMIGLISVIPIKPGRLYAVSGAIRLTVIARHPCDAVMVALQIMKGE